MAEEMAEAPPGVSDGFQFSSVWQGLFAHGLPVCSYTLAASIQSLTDITVSGTDGFKCRLKRTLTGGPGVWQYVETFDEIRSAASLNLAASLAGPFPSITYAVRPPLL